MESSIESVIATISKPKVSNVQLQLEDLAFGSVTMSNDEKKKRHVYSF